MSVLDTLLDTLSGVGYVLDTPGALLRGGIGNVADLVTGEDKIGARASGRELLERLGLVGENTDQGWIPDTGDVAGFAAETVLDPLNLVGAGLFGKAASKAGAIKGTNAAADLAKAYKAAPDVGQAGGGFVDDLMQTMQAGPPSSAAMGETLASPSDTILQAMKRIEPGAERGALVGMRDLREAVPMGKQQFDESILGLSREGQLGLHKHDYVSSLSPEEIEQLVYAPARGESLDEMRRGLNAGTAGYSGGGNTGLPEGDYFIGGSMRHDRPARPTATTSVADTLAETPPGAVAVPKQPAVYNEHRYQVGKKIRSREPISPEEWDRLAPEDRSALQEMQRRDYPPKGPPKPPPPPPSVVRKGISGVEEVTGDFDSLSEADDYVYHVTTPQRAKAILTDGLRADAARSMDTGFYQDYSKGKVFLSDKNGVSYWKQRVHEHLQAQTDDEVPELVVLRLPKKSVNLKVDKLGAEDSRAGAYIMSSMKKPRKGKSKPSGTEIIDQSMIDDAEANEVMDEFIREEPPVGMRAIEKQTAEQMAESVLEQEGKAAAATPAPDVLYHGSRPRAGSPRAGLAAQAKSEGGTWFSTSEEMAKAFAVGRSKQRKGTPTVHRADVDLSKQNLADLSSIGMDKYATPNQIAKTIGVEPEALHKVMQSDPVMKGMDPNSPMAVRFIVDRPAFTEFLRSRGFTGIKAKEGLKSAEDYVPTFKIFDPVGLSDPQVHAIPAKAAKKGAKSQRAIERQAAEQMAESVLEQDPVSTAAKQVLSPPGSTPAELMYGKEKHIGTDKAVHSITTKRGKKYSLDAHQYELPDGRIRVVLSAGDPSELVDAGALLKKTDKGVVIQTIHKGETGLAGLGGVLSKYIKGKFGDIEVEAGAPLSAQGKRAAELLKRKAAKAPASYAAGTVHTLPAMGNRMEIKAKFFPGKKSGEVGVGWSDSDGPYAFMPAESARHFVNDLSGKVDLPANSGNPVIDAIASGHGEWLGKGDDGVVFAVGDKVAKMSTTVPFQPFNPGHRSPEEAIYRLRKQIDVNNTLAEGNSGVLKQEFVQHGDKAFAIRDNLVIPEKLTPRQLAKVRRAIDKIHDSGYVVGDEIQVGLKGDEPILFDLGKAQKGRDRHDFQDDSDHFERFAEKMGGERLPLRKHAQELLKGHEESAELWSEKGKGPPPWFEEHGTRLRRGIEESEAAALIRDAMMAPPTQSETLSPALRQMLGETSTDFSQLAKQPIPRDRERLAALLAAYNAGQELE